MKKEIICGVYKITSPSGKIYIGESVNILKRMENYKYENCVKQVRLFSSLKKYTWEAHTFEVIEECLVDELKCKERYWQEFFDSVGKSGLNCKLTECGEKKARHSQVTKDKISKSNSGKNNGMFGYVYSEEYKQKRKDHRHTEETKLIIGENSKGGKNPKAKTVLNTETGIFYDCVGDAHASMPNISYPCLVYRLNGRIINNTNFVYADDYNNNTIRVKERVIPKQSIKVIDISSNLIYKSITEASLAIGIDSKKLYHLLNKTTIPYLNLTLLSNFQDGSYLFNIKKPTRKIFKKYILDTNTGVFYDSYKEACIYYPYTISCMKQMLNLNSPLRNRSCLILV